MEYRSLPSVDRLLNSVSAKPLLETYGRPLTLQAIRESLDLTRSSIQEGKNSVSEDEILERANGLLRDWTAPSLVPVINATGVILHTNLGRAPLSNAARQAMNEASYAYSNLEYQLIRGSRGKREMHSEELLCQLTGAEAAMVVNNNAAAVLLVLTGLAKRKSVLISRSQLIEIGGGFRIPDVMKQSGAKLLEVGTTNRTHLRDFEEALDDRTALIMQAHHSNFRIIGFTTEPSLEELVKIGNEHNIPVVHDLGSGSLFDTIDFGLGHEPTIQESLAAGVSVVTFSGDKLLGGPQAGILIGKKTFIDKLRKHPLARAIRPDKLCLAALAATLRHYLLDEAIDEIPIWKMIAAGENELKKRASNWAQDIGFGDVVQGKSTVGGGSLPEETLTTWLLSLSVKSPNAFAKKLRSWKVPIISRVEDDRVKLDPRTVLPEQETDLLDAVRSLIEK
ncbi:MAG: L-seryl-tRNA(Sec) selenium transferase [Anaerolineales bacterium]